MRNRACVSLFVLLALAWVCIAKDKTPITDDYITDEVSIRLASDPVVKGGNLKVEVKEGVVTLTGQVELVQQKDKAATLAKKVKGVKQVINHIETKKHG